MLKLFYVYLAGAIEFDKKDGGQGWRDAITPDLDKAGIYVQDPCKTEPLATGMNVMEAQDKFNAWISSGHYDKFEQKFEKIVEKDMRMVHKSDFLIVYLFSDISTTGTIHEMAEAWRKHIPIYLIWGEAKSKLSKWALYLTINSGGRLFDNKKQVVDYIAIRYDLKIQSLRVLFTQFTKAILRIIEEKIYRYRLNKLKLFELKETKKGISKSTVKKDEEKKGE